ncbi:hypothetical protein BDV96DRAFT_654040 [Lophiotrema nucula]|uniref:Uncharacterized protein n=1 Tax=Lophiotrema nucula TaxID=690887 RepID=A0A6A5YJ14_9PLEO|nr:hypothetical protein BDV96DRAFT_654040 [Lophiotrema nucula]
MPFRVPIALRRQAFSTSSRFRRSTLPSHFYTTSAQPLPLTPTAPKLGQIGRWYLPTMALIAASMTFIPRILSSKAKALGETNHQIGFAIANAIEEHYRSKDHEMEQAARHQRLIEAYGDRTTMEDMHRAMEVYEVR